MSTIDGGMLFGKVLKTSLGQLTSICGLVRLNFHLHGSGDGHERLCQKSRDVWLRKAFAQDAERNFQVSGWDARSDPVASPSPHRAVSLQGSGALGSGAGSRIVVEQLGKENSLDSCKERFDRQIDKVVMVMECLLSSIVVLGERCEKFEQILVAAFVHDQRRSHKHTA